MSETKLCYKPVFSLEYLRLKMVKNLTNKTVVKKQIGRPTNNLKKTSK